MKYDEFLVRTLYKGVQGHYIGNIVEELRSYVRGVKGLRTFGIYM